MTTPSSKQIDKAVKRMTTALDKADAQGNKKVAVNKKDYDKVFGIEISPEIRNMSDKELEDDLTKFAKDHNMTFEELDKLSFEEFDKLLGI